MAKGIRGGFVPADDPIFNGSWIVFTPRQMRLTKAGQVSEAEAENQPKPAGNEEPPPAVDPRDEAYTEACEEIEGLERLDRERLSCIRRQYKMVLAEYDLPMDCFDHHKADVLLGYLLGLSFSLGVLGNTEELPKSRHAKA